MYTLVVIFLLSFFDVSNGQCVQINVPKVRFQLINGTWDELLRKQDLATNLYVVGQYNSTTIPVYDTFSQQYGYIMINDPTTDVTFVICTNPYSPLTYLPEPSFSSTVIDLTLTTGLYRLDIPSIHYLYQYDGFRMNVADVVYTTDVIRVSYDVVSTVEMIKGVYLPVCTFHYTDAYIYLSSFISNYQFIADNTDGICVHKHRHGGEIVDEYITKLFSANEDNVIHQKCMIPQLTEVEMNLLNSDCSSSTTSLNLMLDLDRLVVPQNTNTTNIHMSTVAVCLNGDPSRYYNPVDTNSLVIYEDCRSITTCPNGWSNCIIQDTGICNAPNIDCFGSAKPLGYYTCVDVVDSFDYIGCSNASLNPGTYYVSNKYTDLNGYEWYHLCNQDWFTGLSNVRSCTIDEYNQLQCLTSLSRGPSCTIENSFDDSSAASNSQSVSAYLQNTPYFYNITSLGIGDSIHIELETLNDSDKFSIIFTEEQVRCHDVDLCTEDLIMTFDIRFTMYSILTASRFSDVWEWPGLYLNFNKESFPFQLNEITNITITVKNETFLENKFTIYNTTSNSYESHLQLYQLNGSRNYTSLKAISINTKYVSVQSIVSPSITTTPSTTTSTTTMTTTLATTTITTSTTTASPVNTPYFYNLTNLININDTIHIKLTPLKSTTTKFLGVYISDNNTHCDMHSVSYNIHPLSVVTHFDRSDLAINYKRTSWNNAKTISYTVTLNDPMDIFMTLVDTFRVLINVNSTAFLYDLRENFSIKSMQSICVAGSGHVHDISILSNYVSSNIIHTYDVTTPAPPTTTTTTTTTTPSTTPSTTSSTTSSTTTLSTTTSTPTSVAPYKNTPYLYNISNLEINKTALFVSLIPLSDVGRFQMIFTEEQIQCYNVSTCNEHLILVIDVRFTYGYISYHNSIVVNTRIGQQWTPEERLSFNATTFPFKLNQVTNITITPTAVDKVEIEYKTSYQSAHQSFQFDPMFNYTFLNGLSVDGDLYIKNSSTIDVLSTTPLTTSSTTTQNTTTSSTTATSSTSTTASTNLTTATSSTSTTVSTSSTTTTPTTTTSTRINTPYFYNITNLEIHGTIKITVISTDKKFYIYFKKEQIDCVNYVACHEHLPLTISLRDNYDILINEKISNTWGSGHYDKFTAADYPFRDNEITNVTLYIVDKNTVQVAYTESFTKGVLNTYYSSHRTLHNTYDYTDLKAILVGGDVFVKEITVTSPTPTSTSTTTATTSSTTVTSPSTTSTTPSTTSTIPSTTITSTTTSPTTSSPSTTSTTLSTASTTLVVPHKNTPYLYNISALEINKTALFISLIPLSTVGGRFQMIFTEEQIQCYDVSTCNEHLILVIDVRFTYHYGNSIVVNTRIGQLWTPEEILYFNDTTFPFRLNNVTNITITPTAVDNIDIEYTTSYQSVHQSFQIDPMFNYTCLNGLSIDGDLYIKNSSTIDVSQASSSSSLKNPCFDDDM